MKITGVKILKIIGFILLVLFMVGFLKLGVMWLFSKGITIGLYLFATLAAFGLWNIPKFIRGIFGAKTSA